MTNLARRIFSMKRSRFTEQQIAFALQQAEQGTQVAEVTRKMGISEQTFYRWKKKFGGLMPSEVRKLRQLEEKMAGLPGRCSSAFIFLLGRREEQADCTDNVLFFVCVPYFLFSKWQCTWQRLSVL
jgi:putative transposase